MPTIKIKNNNKPTNKKMVKPIKAKKQKSKEKLISCPKCSSLFSKTKMRKIEHPSGAILDVCDNCGGMWIDEREIPLLNDYKEPRRNKK